MMSQNPHCQVGALKLMELHPLTPWVNWTEAEFSELVVHKIMKNRLLDCWGLTQHTVILVGVGPGSSPLKSKERLPLASIDQAPKEQCQHFGLHYRCGRVGQREGTASTL